MVILDVNDCVNEAEWQLHNTENYKKMSHDLNFGNNKAVNKVISRFLKDSIISKNIAEGLKNENPWTTHFYLKPKLHKECIFRRSAFSSESCRTSKMSEYVHYPHQRHSDFLRKLNKIEYVPNDSYLVSLVAESLYTNIPNAEAEKAVKTSLKNYSNQTVPAKVITTLLVLILTLNNFIFNCKNHL